MAGTKDKTGESATSTETVSAVEALRERARELLASGEVGVVIGYAEGSSPERARPVFLTDPGEVDRLVFDRRCVNNLVTYLKKPEITAMGKRAIVVKGCDARAINVLLLENQLKREDIVILGMVCEGVGDPVEEKCSSCLANTPPIYDHLFGEPVANRGWNEKTFAGVAQLEALTQEERWEFWSAHFERCIKCYACRQACPICSCTRCITDKNQPQWVPTSADGAGNFHWNLTRAFHLVGRCVGCNECERACPMDIPLSLINWKLIKAVHDEYGFIAGMNSEDPPPMTTYREGEEQDFIT
jgi:ferredoxin